MPKSRFLRLLNSAGSAPSNDMDTDRDAAVCEACKDVIVRSGKIPETCRMWLVRSFPELVLTTAEAQDFPRTVWCDVCGLSVKGAVFKSISWVGYDMCENCFVSMKQHLLDQSTAAPASSDGSSLESDSKAVVHEGFLEVRRVALDSFQQDREIVLAAVKQNGRSLQFAPEELRRDSEIVLAAVKQNGGAFEYAPEQLQEDRKFVLAVVKLNGGALQYASEVLQQDREVVLAAVKQNHDALEWASEELHRDREVVLASVKHYSTLLKYGTDEWKQDRDVVLAAVKQDGGALQYASKELRQDRDFLLTAVGLRGCALQFASDCFRADRGVVLAAVLQDESALRYADESLQSDQHFLREVSERRAASQNAAIDARFTLDLQRNLRRRFLVVSISTISHSSITSRNILTSFVLTVRQKKDEKKQLKNFFFFWERGSTIQTPPTGNTIQ